MLTVEKKIQAFECIFQFISRNLEIGSLDLSKGESIQTLFKDILLDLSSIFPFNSHFDQFEVMFLDFLCKNKKIYEAL